MTEYKKADGPTLGPKDDGSSIYSRPHDGADWRYRCGTTLDELTREIQRDERILAPGSESIHWWEYLDDCKAHYGVEGNDWDESPDVHVDLEFASHWLSHYESAVFDVDGSDD